jgi:transposase
LPDNIEEYGEDGNTVQVIEEYINGLYLSGPDFSRPQPWTTGRPKRDPKDLLKPYVYGYMNRIRSSRRLEAETKRDGEVMRFLGKLSPDRKTITLFQQKIAAACRRQNSGSRLLTAVRTSNQALVPKVFPFS